MKTQRGFTLIEMAIVLVIVTILIGGLAMPLSAQIQARRIAETRADMQAIHDAMLGYAMSHYITPPSCTCNYDLNGDFDTTSSCTETRLCPATAPSTSFPLSFSPTRHHLPCPDAPNDGNPATTNDDDGIEEIRDSSGDCTLSRGALPWATLGVKGHDVWGNRYTYAVTAQFANTQTGFTSTPSYSLSSPGYTPPTSGNLDVYPDSTCGTASIPGVPVIVVSHGPNGRGAQNMSGGTPLAASALPADERQNLIAPSAVSPCSNTTSFVSRAPSDTFDDLVIWLSANELFNRVCLVGGCL